MIYVMTQYDMIYDTKLNGMICYDMIRYDMICYYKI